MLRFYTMESVPDKRDRIGRPQSRRWVGWLVHIYTASGAVLAFAAGWAIVHGYDRIALGAMFAATIVDSTDGALARRVDVKRVLPDIDGARIDDIVDYLTFVFLPMLLLEASGGLYWSGLPVVGVVLLSSMYGFIAPDAKTPDALFTGFPSYWNIVVLYLLVFRVTPGWNAVILLALSGLIFVRIGYVYPSRTPFLRPLTLTLASIWAMMVGMMIARFPSPPRAVAIASLGFPVYYFVLSLCLNARRAR